VFDTAVRRYDEVGQMVRELKMSSVDVGDQPQPVASSSP
jgi:hypothetical protein